MTRSDEYLWWTALQSREYPEVVNLVAGWHREDLAARHAWQMNLFQDEDPAWRWIVIPPSRID